jgi:lysine/ornithine N-monooxygenase
MAKHLPLLIIGAGPFGLAMSAHAKRAGIEHIVVGKPMEFWKTHMPKRMVLRSACDWHYDPSDEDTIERYLQTKNLKPNDVEPLALDFYLGYCDWFQQKNAIETLPARVHALNLTHDASTCFEAILEDGMTMTAQNVVVAVGFRYFMNVPESYRASFPAGRFAHTCDFVDLTALKNKRVLIIGGRQSAFEWAALISEQGADMVYLSYRHPTPVLEKSDWSWVNPLVDMLAIDPGWFRRLNPQEKEALVRRFWAEGRLKLEPWLGRRISKETIKLLPESQVTGCKELPNRELEVTVNGVTCIVDQIILATGYKVNVDQIPFIANGNVLKRLDSKNGFPLLDDHLQSNVPGLFFTSMCATQDFGPFFAFTAAVRTSAKLIGAALRG